MLLEDYFSFNVRNLRSAYQVVYKMDVFIVKRYVLYFYILFLYLSKVCSVVKGKFL